MNKSIQQESWRSLVDDKGRKLSRYAVSSLGKVKLVQGGHILTPYKASSHGIAVRIRRDNGTTWKPMIRLLVAYAWLPPRAGRRWLNHLNGDWQDCRACNLEWSEHPPQWFGRPRGSKKSGPRRGRMSERSMRMLEIFMQDGAGSQGEEK